jgi:major coat protein
MIKLVSMAKTPEQINDEISPTPMSVKARNVDTYPYGLCIHLETDQLEALGIDGECDVGDLIHLCAMAEVTSCSERKTEGGSECRIELQITHLGLLEHESEEYDGSEEEERRGQRAKQRYGGDSEAPEGSHGGVKAGRPEGGSDASVKPVNDRSGKAGEVHVETGSYRRGKVGAKAASKAVHDPGEAHLGKRNYKAA